MGRREAAHVFVRCQCNQVFHGVVMRLLVRHEQGRPLRESGFGRMDDEVPAKSIATEVAPTKWNGFI